MQSGRYDQATAHFQRRLEIVNLNFPSDEERLGSATIDLSIAHARSGDIEKARRLYRGISDAEVERSDMVGLGAGRRYWNLGCLAALVGERDDAIEWLRRALEAGIDPSLLVEDSDLDGLRGDPKFEELVENPPTVAGL